MTRESEGTTTMSDRKPFAAKYHHRKAGIICGILGALFVFGSFGSFASDPGSATFSLLIGLALLAVAVYCLRGEGADPRIAQREEELAQRKAAQAAVGMHEATQAVAAATTGAAALIAYRNLEATAKRFHPEDSAEKLREALDSVQFEMSRISSPRFGSIGVREGGFVEVFRDYVIMGQEGHDVDLTTRGEVYVDGAVQVTSQVVTDKYQRQQVVNQQHDLRTATMQFTSAEWALTANIHPDHANQARALTQRLDTHISTLKPQAVTSSDLQSMVSGIVNNTSGQTATQRIEELNKLRYSRLLTDEEFARVKNQILGL